MLRIGPEPTDNEISTINIREDNKRIGILKNPNGKYSLDVSGTINCGALTVNGIRATFDGTNSGLWSISDTDTISYVDGSVGIGTEEPAHELDVSGSVNCSELLVNGTAPTFGGEYVLYDDTYQTSGVSYEEVSANITTTSSGVWDLSDSNTISYTNGNVGIGTDSPESALQVAGNIEDPPTTSGVHLGYSLNNSKIFLVPNTSTANSEIEFYSLDSGDYGKIEYDHTNNRLQFQTNSADRMTIDSDGNVGIGTTSPQSLFHVRPINNINDQENSFLDFRADWTSTDNGFLGIYATQTHTPRVGSDLRFKGSYYDTTDTGVPLNTQVMCLKPNGYVGIGTTSPTHILDTSGGIQIRGMPGLTHEGYEFIRFARQDAPDIRYSTIYASCSHIAFNIHNNIAGDDTGGDYGDGDGQNINSQIEVLRLTTDGANDPRVGIGTDSPTSALQVRGEVDTTPTTSGVHMGFNGNSIAIVLAPPHDNAACDIKFCQKTNSESGRIRYNLFYNYLSFYVNFAERMRIDEDGNVGIGTTSILAPLHVAGVVHNLTHGSGRSYYRYDGFAEQSTVSNTSSVTMYAEQCVVTSNAFISVVGNLTSSDERIKNNIIDLEDDACLQQLNLLKPKRYNYKDAVDRGADSVVGFIAQEVQEIIPSAVKLVAQYIPNIYSLATVNGSMLEFSSPLELTVITNGGKIKIYDIQDREHFIDVSSASTTTITLSDSSQIKEDMLDENQIFVYGEEVHDFHLLKKEMIIPVAVGAIQELDRLLIQLKQEKDALQVSHDSLQTSHDSLQASHDSLQTSHDSLQASHDSLQASHDSLKDEMAELKALLQEKSVI